MAWGNASDRNTYCMEGFEYGKTHTTWSEDQLISIPFYYHAAWILGFNMARQLTNRSTLDLY